jgi:multiple sugar transport system substrate-binding protein
MKRRTFLGYSAASLAAPLAGRTARAADPFVFLSTQLRPIEAAQQMRTIILKDYKGSVDFVPEQPPELIVRLKAEAQTNKHTISLVAGVHGELQPLVPDGILSPLDDVAASLKDRGFASDLVDLGKFGTGQQLFIPWMQATYIMAANKKALPHLPAGADINALTYAQLNEWAANVQKATGKRLLGFPAGPTGLMHRFFEGFLLPSYTGGVVTTFRSPAAETAWTDFAALWKTVNPNSTNYNFMQEPLQTGDVWIAFDHVARIIDALTKQPDEFVTFPAPAGPKGRGWMPVLVGLGIPKGAPDAAGAKSMIDYLTQPAVQIKTAEIAGFFPVTSAPLPPDLNPGMKLAVSAIQKTGAAKDGIAALLPVGLGAKSGEFDKIFLDTFQLVVLRGQKPHDVLERQGATLAKLMTDTGAPCWRPDPPSQGACPVT